SAKAAGKRTADPMARRLLLLRQAALADRRAYTSELEYLRGNSAATHTEQDLDLAETAAAALRSFDQATASVYASGGLRPEHPIGGPSGRRGLPHSGRRGCG
ncbi:hypothetical protein ACWGI1_39100, partial [Streptomyces sp. NPDC054835]